MPTQKDAVLARLRKEKAIEAETDQDKVRKEWLESLDRLMKCLRGWLSEAEAQELFSVSEETVELNEDRLGSYEVTALKLVTPSGDVIRVTPRARYVVGAYGRVDLICSPNKAILVQTTPGQWAFAGLSQEKPGWGLEDLGEEAFWKYLNELLP